MDRRRARIGRRVLRSLLKKTLAFDENGLAGDILDCQTKGKASQDAIICRVRRDFLRVLGMLVPFSKRRWTPRNELVQISADRSSKKGASSRTKMCMPHPFRLAPKATQIKLHAGGELFRILSTTRLPDLCSDDFRYTEIWGLKKYG